MSDYADATLDELKIALAPRVAANAAFDGWSDAARDMAADELGVDADVARLALPTPLAMIDAWFEWIDADMAARTPADALAAMKIRERIQAQVEARLDAAADDREALRRALAILARPGNLAHAAKRDWRTADLIWRRAGDTAVDYNHYTKRAILGAVYAATVLVFLDDRSEGLTDTRGFLRRRIDGILKFEKLKAGVTSRAQYRPSLSRFVGRLRYPVP
jgi:ubiquinone biosynthesis protein COQ9